MSGCDYSCIPALYLSKKENKAFDKMVSGEYHHQMFGFCSQCTNTKNTVIETTENSTENGIVIVYLLNSMPKGKFYMGNMNITSSQNESEVEKEGNVLSVSS